MDAPTSVNRSLGSAEQIAACPEGSKATPGKSNVSLPLSYAVTHVKMYSSKSWESSDRVPSAIIPYSEFEHLAVLFIIWFEVRDNIKSVEPYTTCEIIPSEMFWKVSFLRCQCSSPAKLDYRNAVNFVLPFTEVCSFNSRKHFKQKRKIYHQESCNITEYNLKYIQFLIIWMASIFCVFGKGAISAGWHMLNLVKVAYLWVFLDFFYIGLYIYTRKYI